MMREIVFDDQGNIRFKANAIVAWLFDTQRINLNEIVMHKWPIEDQEEFWQMLGYSVSGYGDLSFARPETVAAADEIAQQMLESKENADGLRGTR